MIFVTGTDTDVGKTVVSAVLAQGWAQLTDGVAYLKAVQTGPQFEDSATVAAVAGAVEVLSPLYHYPHPAAPHHAYAHWQRSMDAPAVAISCDELVAGIQAAAAAHKVLICEGAGGLFVPLNMQGHTWKDVLERLGCPYIVVGRSSLGTLNHTALTLYALSSLGQQGYVVMSGKDHPDNEHSLAEIAADYDHGWLGHLPHLDLQDARQTAEHGLKLARQLDQDLRLNQAATTSPILPTRDEQLWHPYTQHGLGVPPLEVVAAQGQRWLLADGHQVFDGISSWWTSILGHGHPELGRTLQTQQQSLDHVLFGGVTHGPARRLAAQVIAGCNGVNQRDDEEDQVLARAGKAGLFARVFFSDNGSTAVEVALKMALVYSSRKRGLQQGSFVALRGGYHGDTLGAMSVSMTSGFHGAFADYVVHTRFVQPSYTHAVRGTTHSLAECTHELEQLLRQDAHSIYGVIVEPGIQGAAGMRFIHSQWLERCITLCADYNIPIILDEVFVGMYRLGTYLGVQQLPQARELLRRDAPQIVCLAKGFTGGTVPLAVTVTKPCVYEVFYSQDPQDSLQHGHTYTANPIACAAALKTHELLQGYLGDDAKPIRRMAEVYGQLIASVDDELRARRIWHEPRAYGSVLAFELGAAAGEPPTVAECRRLSTILVRRGLFLRPLGTTFYLCPALNITRQELEEMGEMLIAGLREWHSSAAG